MATLDGKTLAIGAGIAFGLGALGGLAGGHAHQHRKYRSVVARRVGVRRKLKALENLLNVGRKLYAKIWNAQASRKVLEFGPYKLLRKARPAPSKKLARRFRDRLRRRLLEIGEGLEVLSEPDRRRFARATERVEHQAKQIDAFLAKDFDVKLKSKNEQRVREQETRQAQQAVSRVAKLSPEKAAAAEARNTRYEEEAGHDLGEYFRRVARDGGVMRWLAATYPDLFAGLVKDSGAIRASAKALRLL